MEQTQNNSAVTTCTSIEPINLKQRIGSTTYVVSVHFSKTSKDTLEDKILRLIERESSHVA